MCNNLDQCHVEDPCHVTTNTCGSDYCYNDFCDTINSCSASNNCVNLDNCGWNWCATSNRCASTNRCQTNVCSGNNFCEAQALDTGGMAVCQFSRASYNGLRGTSLLVLRVRQVAGVASVAAELGPGAAGQRQIGVQGGEQEGALGDV